MEDPAGAGICERNSQRAVALFYASRRRRL